MTKSELIDRLADQYRTLTRSDITAAVTLILDAIADSLASNSRVEIRGFGSFRLNHRPSRLGRNPKTGQAVAVPAKVVPHFKPGLNLRDRVQMKAGNK